MEKEKAFEKLIAWSAFVFAYSLIWVWLLLCVSTWQWHFGGIESYGAGLFEIIFGTLIGFFFHFWLMPAVLVIGIPIFLAASVGAAVATFVLLYNYFKSDDKGNLLVLLGPVATGLFAYWGIPAGYNGIIETYSNLWHQVPQFLSWLSQNILTITILYLAPVICKILYSGTKSSSN